MRCLNRKKGFVTEVQLVHLGTAYQVETDVDWASFVERTEKRSTGVVK